ncbi:MAG TPA: thiamine phosphate synthase [Terriglobia bacterium]|nr:thiamine phosphate synthase [Terriglobia bacterium]
MNLPFPRLYAILDAAQVSPRSMPEVTRTLLESGVRLFQYRNKLGNSRELFDACQEIVDVIHDARGIFIVNDRADVALAVGADGVHLGQDDLPAAMARSILPPGRVIGVSTHSISQVQEADRLPVDYIAFGPVFPTRSKDQPDPEVGFQGLREARKATRKPLVAIGGITPENAPGVIASGADSVAVIQALLGTPDISARAREFLEAAGRVR